ncbi:MAG TPA: bifunctional proline dehydrogenase/L-glutamate gamma-semialdehyde dehydrogenase PutA [Rhodocyclaceae bacterium]|nr:bifunctional proline dehydrogenase/L-glutamate gamma-semialdehyde dehydrogenase PutA [Rhodocyclaceae bacterium]HMW76875.1 bifunctional proline dehydrogenase/L-glutamate gamma-semialdehyde dehydrogenase PutA [Rhodocyclaceae bacterium]HNE41849.1 bifunctional proline dehydrogenase/L-glutamate gamma-semialdehyde dehydrogenase PutA [Rhodocyclaceae bacterium]HNM21451.1 bifunctional proline dehydrogenase/L-glutamate gamma-semialdehyde dehydrogenase PutA [Rhodocyclaceae bacterium]HNM79433.1 bifuncti
MSPINKSWATRAAIAGVCRADESEVVAGLATELQRRPYERAAVARSASDLVLAVRKERRGSAGLDSLMQEFALTSQEGVALLCLAEALLRIPDAGTTDRLIRDKLARGDWQAHLGHSPSLFVNAAAWGLMVTGRLASTVSASKLGNALSRALVKGGEPLVRRMLAFGVELLGERFVMGEDIDAALARSRESSRHGYVHSFDMLGEAALTSADARRYFEAYAAAIDAVGQAAGGVGVHAGPGVSVKLSALHPRYCRSQRDRVLDELLSSLAELARRARHCSIGLSIDAEESDRLELSLDLLEALLELPELADWAGLGFVVQAYQKRAPQVVDHLVALARGSGRRLMVRLVKGAYWDGEIKRAQVEGVSDYPVFTRKVHTDLSYLVCAARVLECADAVYPQFATHNAHTVAAVAALARDRGVLDYEFQCLHGMGEALYDQVSALSSLRHRVRIYAPVGSHRTLLPYLVRRLLENGANTSFVHRLVDDGVALDDLIADPLERIATTAGKPHPQVPLPAALFGVERVNSRGEDLADEATLDRLAGYLAAARGHGWSCRPRIAESSVDEGARRPMFNPANAKERIGEVVEGDGRLVALAVARAREFAPLWAAESPHRRARLLEAAAMAIEADQEVLFALLVREAGKTWGNALGEIREAVDFLRYYAARLRSLEPEVSRRPAAPVACISPWNFPLAIFIGQIAAALAAGYPVIAKPAEQTPLIADRAVDLLLRAGIPAAALQLIPGDGAIGRMLVEDPGIGGVLFTGSSAVAREIDGCLAGRTGPAEGPFLVAETGGVNALVVDSSSLPEQVVRDVLAAGFDSAGQRCSALRLLCLQEEIAETTVELLQAAMAELRVGDPADFATDLGPLIDAQARDAVEKHLEAMARAGHGIFRSPKSAPSAGLMCAPALVEIERIEDIPGEIFGPVVHVLRFPADHMGELAERINGMGYGLTFGIHSRIDETVVALAGTVRAGNIYVNRNQIGAVVGVQPFGGEGLSGTGPKAGGPITLPSLMGIAMPDWEALGFARTAPDQKHPEIESLARWALGHGLTEFAQCCRRLAEASPRGWEIRLPGPTGEANNLRWAPRGTILCTGRSRDSQLVQIAVCLASGNRFRAPPEFQLPADLPAEVLDHADAESAEPIAGILVDSSDYGAWRRRAAVWQGPRIPVVVAEAASEPIALYRLMCERVLTVNTAAVGGNADLMGLAE